VTAEQRNTHMRTGHRWSSQAPAAILTAIQALNTGLIGPLPLRYEHIRAAVGSVGPGAYALGYAASDGGFCVLMVGRSDTDVGSKLIDQIGTQSLFKFIRSVSPMTAFEKECELFHDFNPPSNRRHPERTSGTKWTCPRCRQFGR
jgi:hypothetical protein